MGYEPYDTYKQTNTSGKFGKLVQQYYFREILQKTFLNIIKYLES